MKQCLLITNNFKRVRSINSLYFKIWEYNFYVENIPMQTWLRKDLKRFLVFLARYQISVGLKRIFWNVLKSPKKHLPPQSMEIREDSNNQLRSNLIRLSTNTHWERQYKMLSIIIIVRWSFLRMNKLWKDLETHQTTLRNLGRS